MTDLLCCVGLTLLDLPHKGKLITDHTENVDLGRGKRSHWNLAECLRFGLDSSSRFCNWAELLASFFPRCLCFFSQVKKL